MTNGVRITFEQTTVDDFEYFYDLRHRTMLEHFIRAGKEWDETIERENHRQSFNPETLRGIAYNGKRVGFINVGITQDKMRISLFCIEPTSQNCGIGTEVLLKIISEADTRELPVALDVLKGNQSYRLYERMGFSQTAGAIDILDYYTLPLTSVKQTISKHAASLVTSAIPLKL